MTIGDRLRELREAAGVSQARVGEVLGLSASQVSRAEAGKRQISAYELGVVAAEFGWDVRELLGIERPRTKMTVAARLRGEDGSPADALRRAADVVEVDSVLDDVLPSERSNGLTVSWPSPEPTDIEQALKEGEEAAGALRQEFGLQGPITDLLSLCERDLGVDILIAPLGGDCDGAIAVAENLAIVVIDAGVMSGRQRFTIAHEVGHGVFGDVRDTVLVDKDRPVLVEERAQAFASALLMPESDLRDVVGSTPGPRELADAMVHFAVSWSALRRRCDRLAIEIEAETRDLSGPQVFERAGRADEVERLAEPIPARAPSRIVRRVREAYADAFIGSGVVSTALGITGTALDQVLASIPIRFEVPQPSTSV